MYVRFDDEKRIEEKSIVEKFIRNGLVLTSLGFESILENNIDVDEVIEEAKKRRIWLIADEFIREFIRENEEEGINDIKVVVERGDGIFAKEIDSELIIREDTDVSGRSTSQGRIEDFLEYFNDRYNCLRDILKERQNLRDAIPIRSAKKYGGNNISIVAMITSKRESRKGYKFIDVEDPTGDLTVLIPNNSPLVEIYKNLLLDEIIGIRGRFSNGLFIAEEIFQPELPINNKPHVADEPVHLALLSDIHVGSYLFLEKEFNKFINYLNLKCDQREIFEKIKYIIIAGDLVDGIGIYPNQEEELSIPDIYKQYDFLASLLERIPDYIEIILSMGNHDAVRNSEPQPRVSRDIAAPLYELPNVHILGNPVMVEMHSVKTLVYHGTSLDTIISNIAECTYSRPEVAMIELLKRRHLVPIYGNDSISPENRDYLAIREIPDIFHSGHIHTNGYANYRGVMVINSGTFQGRTKYQEELGHVPTPGRVPVVNLQNHEVSIIHF